jgi:dinuclear metal center YbgI/SA1388 family protein
MEMELKAFCTYLNQLLPSDKVADYCPNGLQVEGKKDIQKIATAVSASLETIEEAVRIGADALVVHHGIFWQRDSYLIAGVKKKKLALLLENDLSLIAYHLPLDLHPELGNNWRAAKQMGWSNLEPFGYANGAAIGVKGTITDCTPEQFKLQLEQYYQHPAVCALGGPQIIQTAALISGGAHKSLEEAAKDKIDAFITGSFDEPAWHQAFEEKIHFFALGHSATERVGPQALADHLSKRLQLPCTFIDIFNPF